MASKRTAVVTGASSGVGKAAAQALAAQGWCVIGIGRNPERTTAAEHELRRAGDAHMIRADLALLSDTARAAEEIAALTDRIDVLINNAGGMAAHKVMTAEGFEENFAGNHLGPFFLTMRLLPLLRRAAQGVPKGAVRIINTSSDASEMIDAIPFDDLKDPPEYRSGAVYCYSKLANVLFAKALGQRLASDGIVAHAMHPGTVDSNFASHADERTQTYIRSLKSITSEDGADTVVWLATAEEPGASTGGYWYLRKPRQPNPLVNDQAAVDRLWDVSEKLIAEAGV